MTQEEFAKHLEEGCEWLRAHGFKSLTDIDNVWRFDSCYGYMYAPNTQSEKWRCLVRGNGSKYGRAFIESRGDTPFEAMRNAMGSWDKEMLRRRNEIFKPVIDEIQEQAEKMIEAAKMNQQGMCSVNADELAKMSKDTCATTGLTLTSIGAVAAALLGGIGHGVGQESKDGKREENKQ